MTTKTALICEKYELPVIEGEVKKVEGEGRALGTCVCDDLSMTTHQLQYRGFELDMQETSATCRARVLH